MAYEVRPDGTIIAPDEATALSLARKIRAELRAEGRAEESKAEKPEATAPTVTRKAEEVIADLLRAVAEAGKEGIESSALSQKLGLKPKAISPYFIWAKAKIEGLAPGVTRDVLWREVVDGKTIWRANGEKLKAMGLVRP